MPWGGILVLCGVTNQQLCTGDTEILSGGSTLVVTNM